MWQRHTLRVLAITGSAVIGVACGHTQRATDVAVAAPSPATGVTSAASAPRDRPVLDCGAASYPDSEQGCIPCLANGDPWLVAPIEPPAAPETKYAATLPIAPAPKGLPAPPSECQLYVQRKTTGTVESCLVALQTASETSSPSERDAVIAAGCAPSALVIALRAHLAPANCADALALSALRRPTTDLTPELRDVLHALVLRGRLARIPHEIVPFTGRPDKVSIKDWQRVEVSPVYEKRAALLFELERAAGDLAGFGRVQATAEIASAWVRLRAMARCAPIPAELKHDFELRTSFYGSTDEITESYTRAAPHRIAEAEARSVEVAWMGPRDKHAGDWLQLGTRWPWKLLGDPSALAELIPPWAAALVPDASSVSGLTHTLWGIPEDATLRLEAARRRLVFALRIGSALHVQKALAVLAAVPTREQNDEYRFLLAVALAFRTKDAPGAGLAPCPHLRPLDELGAGNGPFAAAAAYVAADMRAVSQVDLVSGCFEHGGVCEDSFGWLPKRRDAWQRLPESAKQVLARRREREHSAESRSDDCSK